MLVLNLSNLRVYLRCSVVKALLEISGVVGVGDWGISKRTLGV